MKITRPRLCFAFAFLAFAAAAASAFGHADFNVRGFTAVGLALLALGALV